MKPIIATGTTEPLGCCCAPVPLSSGDFQACNATPMTDSMARRSRQFDARYRAWIAEQYRIVEEFGVFGEEHRVW